MKVQSLSRTTNVEWDPIVVESTFPDAAGRIPDNAYTN